MKSFSIAILTVAVCILSACSDDENDWKYGNRQELNGTEWVLIELPTYSGEAFSPVQYPKEQTIRFEADNFTMVTKSSVYDETTNAMRDTTILSRGSYLYEHPTLRMTQESGNSTVEAWISKQNNICFYDLSVFREFKRK